MVMTWLHWPWSRRHTTATPTPMPSPPTVREPPSKLTITAGSGPPRVRLPSAPAGAATWRHAEAHAWQPARG
eukprot:8826140-Lingulodinium_polyedra.AAC.1